MRHLGASVKDCNRNIKIGVNGEEIVMFEHSKTRKKEKKKEKNIRRGNIRMMYIGGT